MFSMVFHIFFSLGFTWFACFGLLLIFECLKAVARRPLKDDLCFEEPGGLVI